MLKKQRHSFQDTYNKHSCTSENLAKQTGRLEFFGRRPAEIEIIEMKMMKQNFILRSFYFYFKIKVMNKPLLISMKEGRPHVFQEYALQVVLL